MAVTTAAREYGQDVLLLTGRGHRGGAPDRRQRPRRRADPDGRRTRRRPDPGAARDRGRRPCSSDCRPTPTGLTCIDLDFAATGALCADHLAELGPPRRRADRRERGGLPPPYRVRRPHVGRLPRGRPPGACARCTGPARARTSPPPARCPGSWRSARHHRVRGPERGAIAPLLSLLRLFGRSVPEDTSVVAICPDQVALQSSPRLTSVSIPAEEMGRRAVGACWPPDFRGGQQAPR